MTNTSEAISTSPLQQRLEGLSDSALNEWLKVSAKKANELKDELRGIQSNIQDHEHSIEIETATAELDGKPANVTRLRDSLSDLRKEAERLELLIASNQHIAQSAATEQLAREKALEGHLYRAIRANAQQTHAALFKAAAEAVANFLEADGTLTPGSAAGRQPICNIFPDAIKDSEKIRDQRRRDYRSQIIASLDKARSTKTQENV